MGGGTNFLLGVFHGDNFPLRETFPDDELIRGIFKLGEFARNLIQLFFISSFLFSISILRMELLRSKFSLVLKEYYHGSGEYFSVEVGPDFLELFKKMIKLN